MLSQVLHKGKTLFRRINRMGPRLPQRMDDLRQRSQVMRVQIMPACIATLLTRIPIAFVHLWSPVSSSPLTHQAADLRDTTPIWVGLSLMPLLAIKTVFTLLGLIALPATAAWAYVALYASPVVVSRSTQGIQTFGNHVIAGSNGMNIHPTRNRP